MSTSSKLSIVFAHGLWADGSCFSKVIPTLQAAGHEVYIAALASDEDETAASLQKKFPVTDVLAHIEVVDGRIWLKPDGIACFAGDLPEQEQKVVWSTQGVPAADLFDQKVEGVAWKSKPSWYIAAKNDRTVHPELQRFCAKRMGATTFEADSSHVATLSQPSLVADVILTAAKSALGSPAAAAR